LFLIDVEGSKLEEMKRLKGQAWTWLGLAEAM
jgi:hypothetical protein